MDKDVVCVCTHTPHTHTHTEEYCSAISKNEILLLTTTRMDLEDIMLSQINRAKTNTVWKKVRGQVAQLCPTLCNPMDHTLHGILQAWILEWVAIPFSRGSSQPRDWTQVSHIAGRSFTIWATRKAHICIYIVLYTNTPIRVASEMTYGNVAWLQWSLILCT